jgi:hypothetical protein
MWTLFPGDGGFVPVRTGASGGAEAAALPTANASAQQTSSTPIEAILAMTTESTAGS